MRLETGDVYYDKMADTPVLPQHDGSKLIKQLLALNIDIGGDNEDDVSSNENRSRKSAISEAIGRPCSVLLHPNDHLFPDWEPLKPIENFALEDGTIEHTDTHRHESIDADGKNVIRRSRVSATTWVYLVMMEKGSVELRVLQQLMRIARLICRKKTLTFLIYKFELHFCVS